MQRYRKSPGDLSVRDVSELRRLARAKDAGVAARVRQAGQRSNLAMRSNLHESMAQTKEMGLTVSVAARSACELLFPICLFLPILWKYCNVLTILSLKNSSQDLQKRLGMHFTLVLCKRQRGKVMKYQKLHLPWSLQVLATFTRGTLTIPYEMWFTVRQGQRL